jgi:hypothetical protein
MQAAMIPEQPNQARHRIMMMMTESFSEGHTAGMTF